MPMPEMLCTSSTDTGFETDTALSAATPAPLLTRMESTAL